MGVFKSAWQFGNGKTLLSTARAIKLAEAWEREEGGRRKRKTEFECSVYKPSVPPCPP